MISTSIPLQIQRPDRGRPGNCLWANSCQRAPGRKVYHWYDPYCLSSTHRNVCFRRTPLDDTSKLAAVLAHENHAEIDVELYRLMQRIADHSKALHGGSSWNVDSTVRSEFGWGSHTAHTAIVTYRDIHSHATVYVSEDRILIILSADPDSGSMYTESRNEDKFMIELADIADVVIKREPTLIGKLHKAKKEVRRQSIFLFLKGDEACVIDTYDSDFSAKVIMITWHANIARRSAGLGTLLNSEDHDVAEAFHRESVTCLHKATKHSEVVEILEDFSQEALSDLELKDVAFRSREFIINCLQLLQNLLYSPCYQVRERGRHTEILPTHANRERIDAEIKKIATRSARTQRFPVRSSGAGLGYGAAQPTMALSPSLTSLGSGYGGQDDDGEEGGELMSEEQQQRLKVIAVERMKLVFCIFKALSALLFSSESLSSRFGLLLGPSPLDLAAWIKLTVADCYKLVCQALGCPEQSTVAQVEAGIALSLQAERQNRSRVNSFRDAVGAGFGAGEGSVMHSAASTPRKLSVADSLLTPLSAQIKAHAQTQGRSIAEVQESDDFVEAMHQLTALQQAIRDLQGLVLYEVQAIFGLAKAMVKGDSTTRNIPAQLGIVLGPPVAEGLLELKQVTCVGDLYVREEHWEEALEDVVTRISGLLHDMASSPHIHAAPTVAVSTTHLDAHHLHHSSSGNLHGGHLNMRLAFSPGLSGNANTFSTSSLPPLGSPGFAFPMVPPSPRSAQASAPTTARPRTTRYRTSTNPSPLLVSAFTPAAAKPPINQKGPGLFGSLHTHGIADPSPSEAVGERRQGVAVSFPLRTQEIMLFHLATLLRALARDSYKIREVMQSDLVSCWRNIIGMLNILCPRPVRGEDSTVHDHLTTTHLSATREDPALRLSATLSGVADAVVTSALTHTPSKKRKNSHNDPASPSPEAPTTAGKLVGTSSKFVKKFMGMFSSTDASDAAVDGEETAGKRQNNTQGRVAHASAQARNRGGESVLESLDEKVYYDGRTDREKELKIPTLYVFDYGRPRYGLSPASWALLVLARCAIEDVILRLSRIDASIILAKPKFKIDDKVLRDISQKIGVGGVIAEGESEEEYSVSMQFERMDSLNSMEVDSGNHPESGGSSAASADNTVREGTRLDTTTAGPDGAGGLEIAVPTAGTETGGVSHPLALPGESTSPMASRR